MRSMENIMYQCSDPSLFNGATAMLQLRYGDLRLNRLSDEKSRRDINCRKS